MANFLVPDKKITTVNGLTICQKIIPNSLKAKKNIASWCLKGQPMKPCKKLSGGAGKPLGITVHNTPDIEEAKGTNDAEQYARATYNGNMAGVVVHFYVSGSNIWQLLAEYERGWHAADGSTRRRSQRAKDMQIGGNLDTIAIECIGKSSASETTTAKLVAYLCYKYGLNPRTDVYQHNYFYPAKNCPEYIRPHWDDFVSAVKKYYDELKRGASSAQTSDSSTESFKVKIIDSALNIRKGPGTNYDVVGQITDKGVYTIVDTNAKGTWGKLKSGAGWICIKAAYAKKF